MGAGIGKGIRNFKQALSDDEKEAPRETDFAKAWRNPSELNIC